MNEKRTFDRLTRAWLDLMPSEAPDRVLDAVLQATRTTPQTRSPLGLVIRRFSQMNRLSIYAAAAAAVIVVAAGVALVIRPSSNVGAPTPTPGASVAPSTSIGPIPAALKHQWMAGPKGVPGTLPDAGSFINLSSTGAFDAHQSNEGGTPHLASFAGITADGRLQLYGTRNEACLASDVGLYAWTVSASGRRLSITAGQDACAARQAVVVGDWLLNACRAPDDACLGEMDAGTYASQYVRPRLALGGQWSPEYAGLTFTVPDGWANDSDWPTSLGLSRAADFARTTASAPDPAPRVLILSQIRAESQASPCSGAAQTGVASTPDAMITWLRSVRGLRVGAAASMTIDGFAASYVDLTLDPATAPSCTGEQLVAYMLVGAEEYAIGAGEPERLIFVNIGGEQLIAIRIEASASELEAVFAAARPIIESLHFN